jgi:lipoate-protein ligase A
MFDDTPRRGLDLMARDAARLDALEADPSLGPSLLWFTWDRPTISLGRLQDPARAFASGAVPADVPVVVRPTGGRAVFHVDEWTYSAVVPLAHVTLGGPLARACRALTAVVAGALEDAYGLPARVAGDEDSADGAGRGGGTSACFARAYGHEIVVDGRKLAGSAQRRGSRALLQQGSLLVGPGHERIARFLEDGGGEAGERALARGAVTLAELLGGTPDPRPFRRAIERRWSDAVAAAAPRGSATQASGQATGVPLDSRSARS